MNLSRRSDLPELMDDASTPPAVYARCLMAPSTAPRRRQQGGD
jgi:hypothetical protein